MDKTDKMSMNLSMSPWNEEDAFNDAFCKRIRELRERRGWEQKQMAEQLGIPPDRYRKYEVRSPMPAYLIERFAHLAETDVYFVLTGKRAPKSAIQHTEIVRRTTLRRA